MDHAKVAAIADALEAELRRLGRWSVQRPPPEAFENMGAFGGRTLAFEQWIQFVLLERIREIVSTRGAFPSSPQVGVYAVRLHFDDGHNTGLYSWTYLRELGQDHDAKWKRYLERCEKLGYERKPPA